MIQMLVAVLICIVIFAILAFGMLWVCNKFFPEFPPARWICGVVLLIILLLAVASQFPANAGGSPFFLFHR